MDSKSRFNISLKNSQGCSWTRVGESWGKGYAFVGDVLYENERLVEYCIKAVCSVERNSMLSRLNGAFAVVAAVGGSVYLIADKMKCFPLLYAVRESVLHVSDTGDGILSAIPCPELNHDNIPYFLSCGYLYGGETLLKDCFLVPPASIVSFADGYLAVESYCSRKYTKTVAGSDSNAACYSVVSRMINRLVSVSHGRQIVIPLSGGYDSRLIACMCKSAGLENVVCYTYGLKTSPETEIARKVASALGFKLHTLEITEEKWNEIFKTDIVKEYLKFGGNLNAVAHLQDFFAVYELNRKKLVADDAVFVPGHSGDLLGGSHFLSGMSSENLVKKAYDKYFVINVLNRSDERKVKDKLKKLLSDFSELRTVEDCYEAVYQWNINCRQPNYIINSIRAYEFFGYSWALPLWDDEFASLWSSIYCEQRAGSKLYTEFVFEKFFIPYSVDFRKVNPEKSFQRDLLNRYLSYGDKYRIRKMLAGFHLYSFNDDNSMLNKASVYIRNYGQYADVRLLPCEEDSMSAKSLFYLYYLNEYCKRD